MILADQRQAADTPFWLKTFIRGVLVILLLLINGFRPGQCQGESSLQVLPPDTTDFPVMTLDFELDGLVEEAPDWLAADQVQVIEDGQDVPVLSLTQDQKGIYFTLVINGSRDLDIRDPSGSSVFDKLRSAIVSWAAARTFAKEDAWSLITTEGPQCTRSPDADDWIRSLENYQPDFRNMVPELTSLENALDMAQDRVVPFGVDKALLFITPPLTPEQLPILNDITSQASQAGIMINVWMVGDPYFLTNQQGQALIDLANATGGEFFYFSGADPIPDPETYFSSLSLVYTLSYASSITETGTYPLEIAVNISGETISGESAPFYIVVLPPKPVLLSPALVITRRGESHGEDSQNGFSPDVQTFEFMVEFPDGYERDILASRLFVDGRLVDLRSEAPFDSLSWQLIGLVSPGTHIVQVEVEDALGLTGRSIQVPVEIEIIQPTPEPDDPELQIGWWIIGGLLGGALILFLVWFIRRLWQKQKAKKERKFGTSGIRIEAQDKSPGWPRQWEAKAALLPLGMLEEDWESRAHFITQIGLTVGGDPLKSTLVLADAGLSAAHAQLFWKEDGFWIMSLHGENALWVNYHKVGTQPVRLQSGDLIHFAGEGFRFTLLGNEEVSHLSVEPYRPLL